MFCRDALSGISSAPIAPSSVVPSGAGEIRIYNLTDRAGNVLQLVFDVCKTGNLLIARLISTKYGDAPATASAFNLATFAWTLKNDGTLK